LLEFTGLSINHHDHYAPPDEPPPPMISSEGIVAIDITRKFVEAAKGELLDLELREHRC
jgi:hypothetical protein